MIGSTKAYDNYFKDDDDYEDVEEYLKNKKKRKIITLTMIFTILIFFITFSIISVNTENPTIAYDLTERNDFSKDFSDPDVIKEYYPEDE